MTRKIRRIALCIAVLGALTSAALALTAGPAAAVSVSTEAELQTAFANAAEVEITLANSIDLTCGGGGDVQRNSATALAIIGNGFTIRQTCAGQRVMRQDGTGALTLQDVTITGGNVIGAGGAINAAGDVTITNSVITGNSSSGGTAGGILAIGAVTVTNSTFTGNSADTDQGGGIAATGAVTVSNSTFSGNSASFDGGGVTSDGEVTVTNSTFAGNSAGDNGGAVEADSITFTNSTATDNTADGDGGGGLSAGAVTLRYATVVQNSNGIAANVLAFADGLESFGSVVALPQDGPNCDVASTASNGFNFSDDDTCEFTGTGDTENGGDPGLAALASNGGPTQTRLPLPGSPLIDAIPVANCNFAGITTDQRGVSRPQGPGCDIGAVEVQPPTPGPGPGPAPAAPIAAAPRFTG